MSTLSTYVSERDRTVVKANDLIQKGRFSLTMQQQKIMLYLISKIEYSDEDFKEYEFDIRTFCRVCGIDCTSGKNYEDLKNHILAISNKGIWGLTPRGHATLRWIEKAYINEDSGKIIVRLDSDMKPFLLQLRENFTQYELFNTLLMKSKYSIRLYELIKSVHFRELETYSRTYTLEELRGMMDADTYQEFRDFNRRALKPAIAEINAYTDKMVTCKTIKHGRKVVSVELTVGTKDIAERLKIRQALEEALGSENQLTLQNEQVK